ncbi:hypothetical protein AGOR_G00055140 [Albula goreensis]|uniref:Uncharacterized protein n=1 Tax=Albula goreensis TaxID=1534307 RepID=A0A8T3DV29_9TELE|nr:hypothetical protein AGOR_G00055140 [Albula goreensis]
MHSLFIVKSQALNISTEDGLKDSYMMAALQFMLVMFLASGITVLARVVMEPTLAKSDGPEVPLTQDTCKDCTQILELFKDMLSNSDTQEAIENSLEDLCKRLPGGQAQSSCMTQVKQYLPMVIHFLTGFIKPGEVCMVLGLCGTQSEGKEQELLTNHIASVAMSSLVPVRGTSPECQVSPQCTFCLFLIKKLESMLPKEKTEDAVVKLLDEVCTILPASYKDQCEDFINKYGKELIEFLLSSAAPHTICTLIHLCLVQELPFVETPPLSECDSCQTLAALSRVQLGSNITEQRTSSFLGSVCQMNPHAIPQCELFTQRYAPKLQRVLGKQGDVLHICEAEDLCVAMNEVKMLGGDPCSWGREYVCRNMKTAQECESVPFCQKYMWN